MSERSDSERLDWLEQQTGTYFDNWIVSVAERYGVDSPDVRDIIDAAMDAEEDS